MIWTTIGLSLIFCSILPSLTDLFNSSLESGISHNASNQLLSHLFSKRGVLITMIWTTIGLSLIFCSILPSLTDLFNSSLESGISHNASNQLLSHLFSKRGVLITMIWTTIGLSLIYALLLRYWKNLSYPKFLPTSTLIFLTYFLWKGYEISREIALKNNHYYYKISKLERLQDLIVIFHHNFVYDRPYFQTPLKLGLTFANHVYHKT